MARQVRVEFDIDLKRGGHVIRVRFVRSAKTIGDFVVQLETYAMGHYRPVVRYDGSHGHPHRDLLDWNGKTIAKAWAAPGTSNNQALTDAIDDLHANADRYVTEFLKRQP